MPNPCWGKEPTEVSSVSLPDVAVLTCREAPVRVGPSMPHYAVPSSEPAKSGALTL
jgi:hypothetical protein